MNTVPRLIENLSWQTIASFSPDELIEFTMLVVLSVGLLGVTAYWIYRGAMAVTNR